MQPAVAAEAEHGEIARIVAALIDTPRTASVIWAIAILMMPERRFFDAEAERFGDLALERRARRRIVERHLTAEEILAR